MIKINVLSRAGKPKSEITLPEAIFGAKINPVLMAQAVRVYLSNQRLDAAHTKTRAEVNRTKAKWFRQKGTGHARHGSKSAPIFVGGGIAHGPRNHAWHLELPLNMKRAALASALTQKLQDKNLLVIESAKNFTPKTKVAIDTLKKLELNPGSKKIGWVLGESSTNLIKAARNIENVTLRNASQLTTYDVLHAQTLILQEDSLDILLQRFNLTPKTSPSSTSLPKLASQIKKATPKPKLSTTKIKPIKVASKTKTSKTK